MIDLLPNQAEKISDNFGNLDKDLVELDESMQAAAAQIGDQPLVASHPVHQYLARRYELNIKSVHWEPDVAIGDEKIGDLQNLLTDHPAQWMIWEGPPNSSSIDRLKTFGIGSVVFNPCGNRPPNQGTTWLNVMEENIERLRLANAPPR